jgi:hypothetical protein
MSSRFVCESSADDASTLGTPSSSSSTGLAFSGRSGLPASMLVNLSSSPSSPSDSTNSFSVRSPPRRLRARSHRKSLTRVRYTTSASLSLGAYETKDKLGVRKGESQVRSRVLHHQHPSRSSSHQMGPFRETVGVHRAVTSEVLPNPFLRRDHALLGLLPHLLLRQHCSRAPNIVLPRLHPGGEIRLQQTDRETLDTGYNQRASFGGRHWDTCH